MVDGTKHCGRLGKSDVVVLYLKAQVQSMGTRHVESVQCTAVSYRCKKFDLHLLSVGNCVSGWYLETSLLRLLLPLPDFIDTVLT